jgi:hypothetical protein
LDGDSKSIKRPFISFLIYRNRVKKTLQQPIQLDIQIEIPYLPDFSLAKDGSENSTLDCAQDIEKLLKNIKMYRKRF